jgi:hypothetical protein
MPVKIAMQWRLGATLFLSLACAVAACDPGPAGPPTEPSDPTRTGYEAPSGDGGVTPTVGGSVEQLCAYVCMRFATVCPSIGDPSCAMECASSTSSSPMCESVFRTFLSCLATSPLTCNNGSIDTNVCQKEINDVSNCMSGISTGSAGATGGGSAGSSGSTGLKL